MQELQNRGFVPQVQSGFTARVRNAIRAAAVGWRGDTPQPITTKDTTGGVVDVEALLYRVLFAGVSPGRMAGYDDAEAMEENVDEVGVGLDILADNATCPSEPTEQPFVIEWAPGAPQAAKDIADEVVKRCEWKIKAFSIARDMLLYGDNFLQIVVSLDDMLPSRLLFMPPRTMVRNETPTGLLMTGSEQQQWAFEQYAFGTGGADFLAGFFPWQIAHLRWNVRGSSRYGRPLLHSARNTWRKLQAMEESLVINWVTRAFTRIKYTVDVHGLDDDAAIARIRKFKKMLDSVQVETGKSQRDSISVVKDIFIGKSFHQIGDKLQESLTDAETLDTSSSAFTNMSPIHHFRNKIIMDTRVPKAYFGIEEDINAKATLSKEDIRFSKALRRIQMVVGGGISHSVALGCLTQGIAYDALDFNVRWFSPSGLDPLEMSQAYYNYSRADDLLMHDQVIDREFIATKHLYMSQSEWANVQSRLKSDDVVQALFAQKGQGGDVAQKSDATVGRRSASVAQTPGRGQND